jgi:hypothetical protein
MFHKKKYGTNQMFHTKKYGTLFFFHDASTESVSSLAVPAGARNLHETLREP